MKRKLKPNKLLIFILIFSSLVIGDQITKTLTSASYTSICNEGIAFGISINSILLISFVLFFILWMLVREQKKILILAMILIFAGGFSNLIDRIIYGCVRDFIAIHNFPSFNLADFALSFGAIIIITNIFYKQK